VGGGGKPGRKDRSRRGHRDPTSGAVIPPAGGVCSFCSSEASRRRGYCPVTAVRLIRVTGVIGHCPRLATVHQHGGVTEVVTEAVSEGVSEGVTEGALL
jgi:hypothetical protein